MRRGFTLVELLVVVLILAILAAMIVPRIISRTSQAKTSKATADLVNLRKMLDIYRIDVGDYPDDLEALRTEPSGATGWKGPYLNKPLPVDPWGNDYVYERQDSENFLLMSYGSDGAEGGETDEAADIIESGE